MTARGVIVRPVDERDLSDAARRTDQTAEQRRLKRSQRLGLTHGVVSRVTSRNALAWLQDAPP